MEIASNELTHLSYEYVVNGKLIKRNAIDQKSDAEGNLWVLVETTGDRHSANTQWVELSFFKMWLVRMSTAA
ncbi:hypothetical protein [Ekhidna sp.]|uniref:hypothetical protein n=1 Tax=Ekhidna sp. TaxID=2608089 RepID=UPI003CCBDD26